jgi:myo-inositol-1(or 4)-monophosphatase
MDPTRRLAAAERAARAGGSLAERLFRTDLAVETKEGKTDRVTVADRDTQRRVLSELADLHPHEAVVGEEEDELKAVPETGPAWVVDPIDGTNNYVGGSRVWATAVACVEDGEPVAAVVEMPSLGDTYAAADSGTRLNGEDCAVSDVSDPEAFSVAVPGFWALDERERLTGLVEGIGARFGDLRRIGSAQATLAGVARGGHEAAVTDVRMNPWDTVAGVHLVREAGGTVTDLAGERWRHDSTGLVASNGACHDALLDALEGLGPQP